MDAAINLNDTNDVNHTVASDVNDTNVNHTVAGDVNDTIGEQDTPVSINDLPDEILVMILERVDLTPQRSTLTNLLQCPRCYLFKEKCVHLHHSEKDGIRNLALVCKHWNSILKSYQYEPFQYYY